MTSLSDIIWPILPRSTVPRINYFIMGQTSGGLMYFSALTRLISGLIAWGPFHQPDVLHKLVVTSVEVDETDLQGLQVQ